MKEVGVCLVKGNSKVTLEGMTGVVVKVGQGQYQEQVLTETELGVKSVENMIIMQKDCLTAKEERETDKIQQMFNLDKEQTSLKMLATDTFESLS